MCDIIRAHFKVDVKSKRFHIWRHTFKLHLNLTAANDIFDYQFMPRYVPQLLSLWKNLEKMKSSHSSKQIISLNDLSGNCSSSTQDSLCAAVSTKFVSLCLLTEKKKTSCTLT